MYDFSRPEDLALMYEEYFAKIYNYTFFRLRHKEQTEDVVSSIFLKVAENIAKYNAEKASFNTWIFTIARNTLIDCYKARRIHVSLDDEDNCIDPSVDFTGQADLIRDEQLREIYKALMGLDARTRNIVALRHFAEYSNRQIAGELGINESTVSTIYLRGLKKLRQGLGQLMTEPFLAVD